MSHAGVPVREEVEFYSAGYLEGESQSVQTRSLRRPREETLGPKVEPDVKRVKEDIEDIVPAAFTIHDDSDSETEADWVKEEDDEISVDLIMFINRTTSPEDDGRPTTRFTYKQIGDLLGGGQQDTAVRPSVSRKYELYGGAELYFKFRTEWCPQLPMPGKHGVTYHPIKSDLANPKDAFRNPRGTFRVFVQLDEPGYMYCGRYKCVHQASLTKRQFLRSPTRMQEKWIAGICNANWGKEYCAQAGIDLKEGRPTIEAALRNGKIRVAFCVIEFLTYEQDLVDALKAIHPKDGMTKAQKDARLAKAKFLEAQAERAAAGDLRVKVE
ncbi:hypothetical protein HK097_006388 [Rhizophlyctis rosea]|uniref:DUF6697 domain-containing protein n=1 Tax=Rhizophlyctis rosea TaxID=64517 RepID=A0AAD5SL10_9FUNG|nr:hypothetical protein HK097_006388 [Rhizophlyctis rosea]